MGIDRKSMIYQQIKRMEHAQDVDELTKTLGEQFSILCAAGAMGHARMPYALNLGEFMDGLNANPFFAARFLIIEAIGSLGRTNSEKAFAVLTAIMNQEIVWKESAIGERIVMELGRIKDPRAIKCLIPLLKRKQTTARSVAAKTLAQMPTEETYKALLQANKKEKDEHVKNNIEYALKQIASSLQLPSPKREEETKKGWWKS